VKNFVQVEEDIEYREECQLKKS